MSLRDKIANAEKTNWVTAGLKKHEVKTIAELARISAKIELARLDLNMTQKEFAAYLGVSQGMVSKWESREYNFTIESLNEICDKLGLDCTVTIEKPNKRTRSLSEWKREKISGKRTQKKLPYTDETQYGGAIA